MSSENTITNVESGRFVSWEEATDDMLQMLFDKITLLQKENKRLEKKFDEAVMKLENDLKFIYSNNKLRNMR